MALPRGTGPYQHGAVLINGTLVDLNDFHLQVVEVRVIEVELALERPVRHGRAGAAVRGPDPAPRKSPSSTLSVSVGQYRDRIGGMRRDIEAAARGEGQRLLLTGHVYPRRCRSTP